MSQLNPARRPRSAYTLAEMLVVMTIMLILVAITLPAIKNVMQGGNSRESSRQLNAYFAMAKARALQTGRPCGVMMMCDLPLGLSEPGTGLNGMPLWPTKLVTKLYLAEVPQPYSGSTIGARGRIYYTNSPTNTIAEFVPLQVGLNTPDPSEYAVINSLIPNLEAFFVRFDFKGAWYLCQRQDINGTTHYLYQFLTQAGTVLPQPPGLALLAGTSMGYSYQIVRLPRRIGNALELPTGTCIDVQYSGIGPTDLPSNQIAYGMYPNPATTLTPPPGIYPLRRLTVMFLPDGGIESIYLNDSPFQPPTTAHFLIGRSDKINPNPTSVGSTNSHPSTIAMYDPALSNLADPQSLWVSVSRSTGNVLTSDNQPPLIDPASASQSQINLVTNGQPQLMDPTQPSSQTIYLSYCRLLATNREQAKTE
jgi:prepilin-type N-terminal cleavage/methylation domain-containing protein